ncbi:pinin/SDK/memA protein [Klebsormidium nitens]|uniref:Pinin/SDK/memA protein n=1 Tax=Klebsormidium nitens TaxID=105231 RepID=A0A1Y1HRC4_KLENI|nr:pinin/SDK/memA protein [Klebsormidium nitens]|eukprot:GAQ81180.1 pinin/SDK/memA protein [Klebsormidium nitens]
MEGEKTEEQLRGELALLEEQQREVDQRLREQRNILSRGRGAPGGGPPGRGRGFGGIYARGRGGLLPPGGMGRPMRGPPYQARPPLREPEDSLARKRLSSAIVIDDVSGTNAEAAPPPKRRQLSSVVARADGEGPPQVAMDQEPTARGGTEAGVLEETRGEPHPPQQRDGPRRNFLTRDGLGPNKYDPPEEAAAPPRVVPEISAPEVKRSRRLFGALLGTLAQFRKEDEKEKSSDAHMKRLTSQQRAEERTRELQDKARKLEREAALAKREKDLVLRNRLAAKTDEKQLEILFLKWTAHEKQLTGFLRTKTEPHLFYVPAKHNEASQKLFDVRQQEFEEWRASRRAELTQYEQQLQEEALRVPESGRWGADASKSAMPETAPGIAPEAVATARKMDVDDGGHGDYMEIGREEKGHEGPDNGIAEGANGNEGEGDEAMRKEPRVKSKSERLSKIHDSDEEEEGYDPTDLDKLLVGDEQDDEL